MTTRTNGRIAYVLTAHPAPSHTFIDREIEELERRGFDITIIAQARPGADLVLSDDDRAVVERSVYIRDGFRGLLRIVLRQLLRRPLGVARAARFVRSSAGLDLGVMGKRFSHLIAALAVIDVCERNEIGHVHAHFGQAPASIAMLAAVATERGGDPITFSLTIHGWHEFVDETAAALALKMERASFVACISDYTRSQLMRISAPEHWEKIGIVRCGLDFDEFPFDDSRLPGTPATLLSVARLSAEKGHLVLLDAVRELRDRGIDVRLRLIGDGPFREAIEARVEALDLTDAVDLLGAQPPAVVRAELDASDVFCLPSFAEGLPVSLMEAMAVGVPVVTTAIAGVPELVVDGETGGVVPAGRADLVAHRVEHLLTDADHRQAVITAARKAVTARHDITNCVDDLASRLASFVTPLP